MNLIGCLDTPSEGRYRLGGEDVSKFTRDELADVRNRRVGFVFQGFNLLPQISAFENVELPLLFGGVAPKKRRERVEELLARVGLADRMDHKPTELSGGQMQRVAIARALAMKPDVVLADEPTGNLDTSAGGDIMGLFTDLWQQGSTLVVITHDMTLARRAGRVVEIRDGRDRPGRRSGRVTVADEPVWRTAAFRAVGAGLAPPGLPARRSRDLALGHPGGPRAAPTARLGGHSPLLPCARPRSLLLQNPSVSSIASRANSATVGSGSPASSLRSARSASWWSAPRRLTASSRIVRLRSFVKAAQPLGELRIVGRGGRPAGDAAARTSCTYFGSV